MTTTPKVYMGSWCFTFGFERPAPLETVVKVLSAFGFDGVSIGAGFSDHAPVERYPDKASRARLVDLVRSHDLEVAGYAPDPYVMPWATGDDSVLAAYTKYFDDSLSLAADIGAPVMRVDPGSFGPLARDADYSAVWDRVVTTFSRQAKQAAEAGVLLVWEPETGQVFVKPSEILQLLLDVGSDNFKISYDFGHGQAIAVMAHNQVQPLEQLEGGQLEFIAMLSGHIGDVGINDNDNNTWSNLFGSHLGLGRGVLDFEAIIPAIIESGFRGPWWGLDVIPMGPIVWTDAWNGLPVVKDLLNRHL
ncbi:sugar phosphate isomerase/epimerase family protein [Nocardioides sp.]|uniref:sugar phosphate isomerase/epimerase family protein n=1 Tax=Nocardioides sp. TaxID=35761 RepID=UPI00262BB007|nr:sugar phosphate isomerase/epimerase family protein [Nocardioides sp.]MDI6911717.1 sugar phosphate isomerase/epimerase family protein [Nocardioides sp.]